MTVNTLNITSGPFVGNGVADSFAYTFKIEDKSQVKVFETDDNKVETVLVVDTDYTVAGIGVDGGGTITRVAGALPIDFTWFIRSDYIETQLTDFDSQGGFFPDVHEDALDKLTFLIQQIIDEKDRSPSVSNSYTGPLPLLMPDPVAGKIIRWLGDLSGFENIDVSDLSPGLTTNDRVIFAFKTLAEAIASTDTNVMKNGAILQIGDRANGLFDIVLIGTITPNTFGKIALVGVPSLGLQVNTLAGFKVKEFGAKTGQQSIDAIEACIVAGGVGAIIHYGDASDNYLVDAGVVGELSIIEGQVHCFNWSHLTRTVLDNVNSVYRKETAVKDVIFKEGFIKAFTDDNVGGESATNACIRIVNADNIRLYWMDLQEGGSGFHAFGCTNIKVYDSNIIENTVTGISGIADNVELKRTTVRLNGFGSGGFTHEVYLINSSFVQIIDCDIGDNKDGVSSVNAKNKNDTGGFPAFTECKNWRVKSRFFGDAGLHFTNAAAEGDTSAQQAPHSKHLISGCTFTSGAGLLIRSPDEVVVHGCHGVDGTRCAITDSSTFAGYVPSCQIGGSTFGTFAAASTTNFDANTRNIVFKGCTALTSVDALIEVASFGGSFRATIAGMDAPFATNAFDTAVLAIYVGGTGILVRGDIGDFRGLAFKTILATASGLNQKPVVYGIRQEIEVFGTSNTGVTIDNTDAMPNGSILEFFIQQDGTSGNRTVAFGTAYKLTANLTASKSINVQGQFLHLVFIRRGGFWHQSFETDWV